MMTMYTFPILKKSDWGWKVIQKLGVLVALTEDPGFFPDPASTQP